MALELRLVLALARLVKDCIRANMLHPNHDPESRAAFGPTDSSAQGGPAVTDEPPSVFKEGQVLNNTYRIVRLIGEGGMGVVFEAKHARLAGRYAIKVLLRRLSENPEAMARFDSEARITSSLQHPNIVQVIDFNRLPDGTEFLVMEYLQGETLGARLSRMGSLPVKIVAGIVEQIAAGLAAAHSHGVVHRDLKPENIFLVPVEGRHGEVAKVLDFGISKMNDAPRRLGPESGLMGTPQFMSPEQCRGRPAVVDAASDQFALAALTYQMLTGRTPFSGDNVGAVLWHVLYDNPLPMGIETEVERVVIRALSKEKEGRFSSVTAFAEALCAAAWGRLGVTGPVSAGLAPVARIAPVAFGAAPSFEGHGRASGRGWRGWGVAMFVGTAISVSAFFVVENIVARSVLPLRYARPAPSLPEVAPAVEIRPIVRRAVTPSPANPNPPSSWPVDDASTEARSADVRPVRTRPTRIPSPQALAINRRREGATRSVGSRPVEKQAPASSQHIPLDGNAVLPLDESFGDRP